MVVSIADELDHDSRARIAQGGVRDAAGGWLSDPARV
jgi:hypothetical protein